MYNRSDMVYTYKWQARADHDNPKIIAGTDHNQLNREEGYEMLYFIRSLAKGWNWPDNSTSSCQNLERAIKETLPSSIRSHGAIRQWLEKNYSHF